MSTAINVTKIMWFARVAATSVSNIIKVIMNNCARYITKRNSCVRNIIDNTLTHGNNTSSTISHFFSILLTKQNVVVFRTFLLNKIQTNRVSDTISYNNTIDNVIIRLK